MSELVTFIDNMRAAGPTGWVILIAAGVLWLALIIKVLADVIFIFRNHRSW